MRTLLAICAAAALIGGGAAIVGSSSGDAPCGCVVVHLDPAKVPNLLDHVWDEQEAGRPVLMTVDRADAIAHRAASLQGIPTKTGFDRDEYPPAMAAEGGKGADVRYVPSFENRSAGSSMGYQLRDVPDGGCFRFESRR
jgi:hypothetical protein